MSSFDAIAEGYDEEFTHTLVGQFQRKRVYAVLKKIIKEKASVLELNCGTGEDAIWLENQGCQVLATDVSAQMIAVAQQKIKKKALGGIELKVLETEGIVNLKKNEHFDLVFSNFGGLNCLSPVALQKIAPRVADVLKTKGKFVAVIMPRYCWWERFYFSIKGQGIKAKRRLSQGAIAAPLDASTSIDTWYYNVDEFVQFFEPYFKLKFVQPIGFALPPSYLDNWFKNKSFLLKLLNKIEGLTPSNSFFANRADHCLIELERK